MSAQAQELDWRHQAACRGLDVNVFYPASEAEAGSAKAICAICVVRDACLEHALVAREDEGVWGGLTWDERRRLRRRRRDAARRAAAA